jgi:hypothetical protein
MRCLSVGNGVIVETGGNMKTCGMIASRIGVFTVSLIAIIVFFEVDARLGFFVVGLALVGTGNAMLSTKAEDRRRP